VPVDQPGQPAGNAGLAEASPPPAWPGFRPLAVTGISRESETVISLLSVPGYQRSWDVLQRNCNSWP